MLLENTKDPNEEIYHISEWGDNIIKIIFLPNLIYTFNAIQINIPGILTYLKQVGKIKQR